MRDAVPSCTIDWTRTFCLPAGVPPETVGDAGRVEYANGLDARGEVLLSTYGRFFAGAPDQRGVRLSPRGATTQYALPAASVADSDLSTLPAAADLLVDTKAFKPTPPAPGTAEQVAAALESHLPRDKFSRRVTALPIPFADRDTVRLHFPIRRDTGFSGTLGLDEPGVLAGGAALPGTLLETRVASANLSMGELDRLLLRAPVAGRFRFEPYYVYRKQGAAYTVVGPSNSGRLLVHQPDLRTLAQDPADSTDTKVFSERLFVFEHVDRATVAPIIHSCLVLQLEYLGAMLGGADPRLTIPPSNPSLLVWVLTGLHSLLRAWIAFLKVLAWRPQDTAVAAGLPADWLAVFPTRAARASDAATLLPIVTAILGNAAQKESLLFFSEHVYAPLLAGRSWIEVLQSNSQDPDVRRFPVPSDKPPYTPRNAALVTQVERLRLLEDPQFRWIACYAGCPLGKPSLVFAPHDAPDAYPDGALTTYEVEALHVAGTADDALSIPVGSFQGPRPGQAMDVSSILSPYVIVARGNTGWFSAERLGSAPLHTAVDWLVELTRGIHFRRKESGFLDLFDLMDSLTGEGHPLLEALRADENLKAVHLRRQLDELDATTLGADLLAWWDGHLHFTRDAATGTMWHFVSDGKDSDDPPAPRDPFRSDRTRLQRFLGILDFDDLVFGSPTGWDEFDIESAYLACTRMAEPIGGLGLPVAALLALMEREGIALFAPINRHVRDTRTEAATLSWASLHDDPTTVPVPNPRSDYGAGDDQVAREAWLSYPYGLDTFASPNSDAGVDAVVTAMAGRGVFTLGEGEHVAQHIRERVLSTFQVTSPGVGIPRIWKRTRRAHWACLSLMAGFFRHMELGILSPTVQNGFAETNPDWRPSPGWLPAGLSPPDLTGKSPNDPEWKDYLSYYGMIYYAYNAGEESWRNIVKSAEDHRPANSPLSLRDWLLFQEGRQRVPIGNVGHFVIGLDALLRLDYMESRTPATYGNAHGNATPPSARTWSTQ